MFALNKENGTFTPIGTTGCFYNVEIITKLGAQNRILNTEINVFQKICHSSFFS